MCDVSFSPLRVRLVWPEGKTAASSQSSVGGNLQTIAIVAFIAVNRGRKCSLVYLQQQLQQREPTVAQ